MASSSLPRWLSLGRNNRPQRRVKNLTIAITKLLIHYNNQACGVKSPLKTTGQKIVVKPLNMYQIPVPWGERIKSKTIEERYNMFCKYTVTHCYGWRWILRMRTFRLGDDNALLWGGTGWPDSIHATIVLSTCEGKKCVGMFPVRILTFVGVGVLFWKEDSLNSVKVNQQIYRDCRINRKSPLKFTE